MKPGCVRGKRKYKGNIEQGPTVLGRNRERSDGEEKRGKGHRAKRAEGFIEMHT